MIANSDTLIQQLPNFLCTKHLWSNQRPLHTKNVIFVQTHAYCSSRYCTSSPLQHCRATLRAVTSVPIAPVGFAPEFLGIGNHAEGHSAGSRWAACEQCCRKMSIAHNWEGISGLEFATSVLVSCAWIQCLVALAKPHFC